MQMSQDEILDEAALAARAGRDPQAFSALYRRYLRPLYGYLYNRSGDRLETEDLVSQVFMEALEGLVRGRYQPRGSFSAWLFTIARRRAVDRFRARRTEPLYDLADTAPGPAALAERRAEEGRLSELLNGLDESSRELLRLRFAAGLSFAQIGEIDGRSEAAVKMAIYRLLDKLRNQWEYRDVDRKKQYIPTL